MTLIKQPTPENILLAARNLKAGALIGLPTETVYGLAADADHGVSRAAGGLSGAAMAGRGARLSVCGGVRFPSVWY